MIKDPRDHLRKTEAAFLKHQGLCLVYLDMGDIPREMEVLTPAQDRVLNSPEKISSSHPRGIGSLENDGWGIVGFLLQFLVVVPMLLKWMAILL